MTGKLFIMPYPTAKKPLSAYSYGAIWLHWLIALAVILQLAVGFTMVHEADVTDQTRFVMFQWHKTIGILVLLLTLARIVWRLINRPPAKAPMLWIEKVTADLVSFLFYVLMLAVPLTGWLLVSVSSARIPTLLFLIPGLVWPNLPVASDAALAENVGNVHAVLAYSFVFLLFLHIGGALKHSIIDRVPEISRMLPTGRLPHKRAKRASVAIAVLVFLTAGLGGILLGQYQGSQPAANSRATEQELAPALAFAANWTVNYRQSSLSYQLDFSGTPQNGEAKKWNANIHFDPDHPDEAKAEIIIDAASISYDDAFVSGNLREKDGLDIAGHTKIRIVLDKFTQQQGNWLAMGNITIRGITQPLAMNFTFNEQNNHAMVTGSAEIDRLAFDIGRQNDPDGTWLGKTVRIKIQLDADKNG